MLKLQYQNSEIVSIKDSGVGMFVEYKVHNDIRRLDPSKHNQNFEVDLGYGVVDGNVVMGLLLFVRRGYIDFLEVYTFEDDVWKKFPDDLKIVKDIKVSN